MKSKKRKTLLFIVAALIGFANYYDYLTPGPGYCWKENLRLTDQQLREIAVQHEIDEGRLKIDELHPSAKHFIATHPKCCELVRKVRGTLIEKLSAPRTSTINSDFFVYFIFEANEFNSRTKKVISQRYVGEYVLIDACGEIVGKQVMGRRSLEIE